MNPTLNTVAMIVLVIQSPVIMGRAGWMLLELIKLGRTVAVLESTVDRLTKQVDRMSASFPVVHTALEKATGLTMRANGVN